MKYLFVALLFICSIAKAATPIPGPDCGAGATIVGTENAGKITLGTGGNNEQCTLTGFSWPGNKVPSCAANLEVALFDPTVRPDGYYTISTATTLIIGVSTHTTGNMEYGYVVSYLCVGQ